MLADAVAAASGIRFADYLAEGTFGPLGMTASRLDGPAGYGGVSTCADLARFAAELQVPTLLAAQTLAEATQTAYPGLDGVLPGYGMQRPNAGVWASSCVPTRARTGRGVVTRRRPSATSGGPGRSCGWIRSPGRPASP